MANRGPRTDMPEVVDQTTEESPEAESQAAAPKATQPADEIATWKRRLAGKDQALTASKKELTVAQAELEALRKWKLDKEQADLTEVQKLELRVKERDAELVAAREEARRERLTRQFPLAMELYADGDDPLP